MSVIVYDLREAENICVMEDRSRGKGEVNAEDPIAIVHESLIA